MRVPAWKLPDDFFLAQLAITHILRLRIPRKLRGFRPGGSFDNSPAIYRWGGERAERDVRPGGTVEPFDRPSGTFWGKTGEMASQQ